MGRKGISVWVPGGYWVMYRRNRTRSTTFKTTQTRMIHQMFTSKVNRTPWSTSPRETLCSRLSPEKKENPEEVWSSTGRAAAHQVSNPSKRRRMPWSLSPWKKLAFRLLDTTEDRVGVTPLSST